MKRIVIAGTESGVGKTTVTIGLMAALIKRGIVVQGFKCGPDFVDPIFHRLVTNRTSRNLDSWLLTDETIIDILTYGSRHAHMSIIEGVMGLFDSENPSSNKGSTAEISVITNSPVLLVVDCERMARSAAAVVKGYQLFAEDVKIVGVVANKVGGEGHFQIVKEAIEKECNIPVIGYLPKSNQIEMKEGLFGLDRPLNQSDLKRSIDRLGELVVETIDIEKLLKISEAEPIFRDRKNSIFEKRKAQRVKIAVAKDEAFCSYYQENLDILEANGGETVYFSPLANEELPKDVDGLYISGNFPEQFVPLLEKRTKTKESIKHAIEIGLPTYAECGGFMFLAQSIETVQNEKYEMIGMIPGNVKITPMVQRFGYREIWGVNENFLLKDERAKGQQFHYSLFSYDEKEPAYAIEVKANGKVEKEGYVKENLVACFTHIHFGSNPSIALNFLEECHKYRKGRKGG